MKRTIPTVALITMIAIPPWGSTVAAEEGAEQSSSIFVSAVEVKAGRAVAEQSCARCHGLEGISADEGLPHLAGQHADYLFKQLKGYTDGTREHSRMARAVGGLNEEALMNVAAYYSSLAPPRNVGMERYQGEERASGPSDVSPVDVGAAAAEACIACHGPDGNSIMAGMPNLTGQHPDYLAAATKTYKDASRKDSMMQPAVGHLDDEAIENVALYYAMQEPKRSPYGAPGNVVAGQAASADCTACHGDAGISENRDTPNLAGQDAQYLVKAIKAYQDGARSHAGMQSAVAPLADIDINNLAAYYASLAPQAPEVTEPLTTAQWVERCDRCHGIDGNSIDPRVPSLAGQRADYTAKAMAQYQSGERQSKLMHAMSVPLRQVEINNLATYYAGKARKSVIFVKVPCE